MLRLLSVLVSYCCQSKWPQTEWLHTTFSHRFGGQKSQIGVFAPSKGWKGDSFLASFSSSWLLASLGLWQHDPNLHLDLHIATSVSPWALSSTRTPALGLGPPLIQYDFILNYIFKDLFPSKVGVMRFQVDMSFGGHYSSQHTKYILARRTSILIRHQWELNPPLVSVDGRIFHNIKLYAFQTFFLLHSAPPYLWYLAP